MTAQASFNAGVLQNRFDLRSKDEPIGLARKIEWLDTQPVPSDEQRAFLAIPDRGTQTFHATDEHTPSRDPHKGAR